MLLLRPFALLLLLANVGWFAWSQGYLVPWGLEPGPAGEPLRLQRQLQPEWLRIERAVAGEGHLPATPGPAAADAARPSSF